MERMSQPGTDGLVSLIPGVGRGQDGNGELLGDRAGGRLIPGYRVSK